MLSTSTTPYLAVIDADMQHDERILPEMLALVQSDNVDPAIGSRYTSGGSLGDWDGKRALISGVATTLVCSRSSLKAFTPILPIVSSWRRLSYTAPL